MARSTKKEELRGGEILRARGLDIRRGDARILRGMEWTVRRGEHWVILGPNGSGKTSLLKALCGYLTPSAGEVEVLGQVYGESDWRELRLRVGIVSSSVSQQIREEETAAEVAISGRYAMINFWGNEGRNDRRDALAALGRMGCRRLADRRWGVLSQGERQRALIARALMGRPELLILDEPCAGLDPVARESFLSAVEALGKTPRCPALVIVTHHVEEIMPIFTRALLIRGGRPLFAGPIVRAMNEGLLTECFGSPVRARRRNGRYALVLGRQGRKGANAKKTGARL